MKLIMIVVIGIMFSLIACNDGYDNGNNNPGNMTGNQPEADEVWMENTSFVPKQRTVSAGTTVTWINMDGTSHTITSDDGLFNANVKSGGKFTFTFDDPGTYNYTCTIHANMDGTIIVN